MKCPGCGNAMVLAHLVPVRTMQGVRYEGYYMCRYRVRCVIGDGLSWCSCPGRVNINCTQQEAFRLMDATNSTTFLTDASER